MNLQDIIDLSKAGWTKSDIMKLTGNADNEVIPEQTAPADSAPTTQEPEAQEPEVKAEPAKEPMPEAGSGKLDEVIARLEKLSSGMQAAAIQGTRLPERESVDDILAQIINPLPN